MANTNFAALTSEQLTIWSRDFWRVARNMSFINQFAGSGPNAMVQRISELTQSEKGARAVITLLADMTGDGHTISLFNSINSGLQTVLRDDLLTRSRLSTSVSILETLLLMQWPIVLTS